MKQVFAPEFDDLVQSCQSHPEIKNTSNINQLKSIFQLMANLEKQGDDEFRSIWFFLERGKTEDFGDFKEYLIEEIVETKEDFEALWLGYYPEPRKWYSFAVSKYEDVLYFYVDSKLTLQGNIHESENESDYDFYTDLITCLHGIVEDTITRIRKDEKEYNEFISNQLPYKKRIGRILRKDFWTIFPDFTKDFRESITPEMITMLEKIKEQTKSRSINYLQQMSAGNFFRYCEIGYDANQYFNASSKNLTPKEKYKVMADRRDCGLTKLDEESHHEFEEWYKTEMNCGGHPWEICRGGNSTHISLFVCRSEEGWHLRLAGSSRARVLETIKMAIALHQHDIPFLLGKAEEIYRMATGTDFIGIVPDNVIPRYCHSYFPEEDEIIDFMNLGDEKQDEIIEKAFWYPISEVRLIGK